MVDGLADGNLAIFIDVYKQALAYNKSSTGLEELDRMLKAGELRDERQLRAGETFTLECLVTPRTISFPVKTT